MTHAPAAAGPAPMRRRDLQKEQTRLDLALAAFRLAKAEGLAKVRVPQIAEAVGVSPRTFNNYFPSKEAAIVWPATIRGARLAADLAGRPADEPLADALAKVMAGLYGPGGQDGLPEGWLEEFRALAAAEPALHGEYLKAQAGVERDLAQAIARRAGTAEDGLETLVLAGVVMAAERAAVRYWLRQAPGSAPLAETVATAVGMAARGAVPENGNVPVFRDSEKNRDIASRILRKVTRSAPRRALARSPEREGRARNQRSFGKKGL